jgi:hypothetical protein
MVFQNLQSDVTMLIYYGFTVFCVYHDSGSLMQACPVRRGDSDITHGDIPERMTTGD